MVQTVHICVEYRSPVDRAVQIPGKREIDESLLNVTSLLIIECKLLYKYLIK